MAFEWYKKIVKMASLKVEICLKKKTQPEHKYSVRFVTKVGTKTYPTDI